VVLEKQQSRQVTRELIRTEEALLTAYEGIGSVKDTHLRVR